MGVLSFIFSIISTILSLFVSLLRYKPPIRTNESTKSPLFRNIQSNAPQYALMNGSYQWGRYLQPIVFPNVHARSIFGDILGTWRLKEWSYCSVTTRTHMIAFAIVQLNYLANVWCYIVELDNPKNKQEFRLLSPLGADVSFALSSINGQSMWKKGDKLIKITTNPASDVWNVTLNVVIDKKPLYGSFAIKKGPESLCLLYPFEVHRDDPAKSRAAYTHKCSALQTTGSLHYGKDEIILNDGLACFDWTRSFAQRETKWKWTSFTGVAEDANGNTHKIGVNLSAEVYNDTENFVIVDGKLHDVGPIDFIVPGHPEKDTWHIRTPDLRQVVLSFSPSFAKIEKVNVLVLKDRFKQFVGTYNGVIRIGEQVLHLKQLFGVAEEHYALW